MTKKQQIALAKRTLKEEQIAFTKLPNARNYAKLEDAMIVYQDTVLAV